MRIAEALDVLGLDRLDALERTALRRHYMRLLRDHPPERDPDGFKRLREAFELVRRFASDDAPAAPPPDAAPAVVVESSAPPAQLEVATPAPIAPPEPPAPAPAPAAPDPEPIVEPPSPHVAAEPPRSELPRIVQPVAPEPPLTLAVLVGKLLELLGEGLVEPAVELERDWRTGGDVDDFRGGTTMIAARWVLLRELLPIAPELPVPVVRALAKAIAEDDLSLARPALETFQRAEPARARDANGRLAARAPTVFASIRDTLAPAIVKPPRTSFQVTPPRRTSSSSGSGRAIWIGIVIAGALARLLAGGGSSTTSYEMPKYELPELKHLELPPPNIDYAKLAAMTKPLPYEITDTSPETLSSEILQFTDFIADTMTSAKPEHKAYAATLRGAVVANDCTAIRGTLAKWLAFSPIDAPVDPPSGSDIPDVVPIVYLEPIRQRVDLLCPKPPAKRGKRPARAKHAP